MNKILLIAVISQLLFTAGAQAAIHTSCADVEKIMQAIDIEADQAFTQDNYQYHNDQLNSEIDAVVATIGSDALNKAVKGFHATKDSYQKVTSDLADISGILYEWDGEHCFE
ncbi:MAG: hypothetical protein ACPG4U_06415 [Pseudomonadales bacterium]